MTIKDLKEYAIKKNGKCLSSKYYNMHKKYSQGEFSGAGGKAPKESLESWSKAKITQGSHNN